MPAECLLSKLFSRVYPARYKFENGGIEIKRIYKHGEKNVNQFALAQEVLEHGDVFSRAMIASVYKGIHIKTTKNGLPTY